MTGTQRPQTVRAAEIRDKKLRAHSNQAVVLFSQAQQVADALIEEAVKRAREMLFEAHARQRENV